MSAHGGERRLTRAHEQGQTAVEYLGVLGVIALIVAVLAASNVVPGLRAGTRATICDTLSDRPCDTLPAPPEYTVAPTAASPLSWVGTAWRTARSLLRGLDQTHAAFMDGAVRGDFNRDGYDSLWYETARAAGHLTSGLLVYGDLRDAAAALHRLWRTNGTDGWSDLGWSTFGILPIAGDLARTLRTTTRLANLADTTRLLDEAADMGQLLGRRSLPPTTILLSQSSVNDAASLAERMAREEWNGPPIDVVRMTDGSLVGIDNTRVVAAHRAGVEVEAIVHDGDEILTALSVERFTTRRGVPVTWEDAVRLRIRNQSAGWRTRYPNGGPVTGSPD